MYSSPKVLLRTLLGAAGASLLLSSMEVLALDLLLKLGECSVVKCWERNINLRMIILVEKNKIAKSN